MDKLSLLGGTQPVISDAYIPYIRPQIIKFTAVGLKPNTKLYPFFDGIDVSAYCTPSFPTTDATGALKGSFSIPASTFTVGTKVLVLMNASDYTALSTADCVAQGTFTASQVPVFYGDTSVSTQPHTVSLAQFQTPEKIVVSRQTTVVPNSTQFKDPVAQTFFVAGNPNGVFVTDIDVYFETRPTDPSIPITLQIREVVNGYPSDVILPYSTVTLDPKDVNPSEDASAPTVFTFSTPVYLSNNTEYCFVLLPAGGSSAYTVWTAQMGSTILGTTAIIDKQPNAGRLILSANGIDWTVQENQDIKFTVYVASFTSSGTFVLKNQAVDYVAVTAGSVAVGDTVVGVSYAGTVQYLTDGVAQISVSSGTLTTSSLYVLPSLSPETGTVSATTSSSTVTGTGTTFTSLSVGDILLIGSSSLGEISTITDNTHVTLTAHASVNASGQAFYVSTSSLAVALDTKKTTGVVPLMSALNFSTTTADWTYKTYSPDGSTTYDYTPLPLTSFSTPQVVGVLSYSDKTAGSLFLKGTATSSADHNVSPAIDLSRTSLAITNNQINDTYTDDGSVQAVTPAHITGTVDTSGATVTGDDSNTKFTTEIPEGSVLRDLSGNVVGVVRAVVDDTHLTLVDAAPTATDSKTYWDVLVDPEGGTSGFAACRYITKNVALPTGQDAEDFRVYLNATIPGASNILVYARLVSGTDGTPLDSRPWVLMTRDASVQELSDSYLYTLPQNGNDEDTGVGGLNSEGVYQYTTGASVYTGFVTFAVKIVLTSDDASVIPTITCMRAVALQA